MNLKQKEKLLKIFNNLFNPINKKDYGLYWLVSHNKSKPLADAEALLKYVEKEVPEGSFINRYADLENELILEGSIYLDFDLTAYSYLKEEKGLTEKTLEELIETTITITDAEDYNSKNNKTHLKAVQKKYKKDFTVENGFKKGFNYFIDRLTEAEAKALKKLVSIKENEEVKKLKSVKAVQKYFLNKFEKGYLKEPFKEATRTANYFNHIGVKSVLNFSGSKGLALRIPITAIDFKGTELEENPENVKLFLVALAELIETKLLEKTKGTSSLDYAVFCKGMQRVPTSKHNKTKLYANFIEPTTDYLEAIDVLEEKVPSYIPEEIDSETNTKVLTESDIYKATLKKAVKETELKTYSSEVGNVAYNFKSNDHKKLKEMILEIYPESLNFFPYKVIHLLKRTGFNKEEVEAIFHDIEPNEKEYNKNIKGNIKYTFDNPNAKIIGLKNLIEWIKETYPNHEKDHVIKYFSDNFSYYEKPVETVLEDALLIDGKEYYLTSVKTSNKEYYVINDFLEKYILEVNKQKGFIYFKQSKRTIAKLEIKKNEEGIVSKSKEKLEKFKERIENKTKINPDVIEEAITELDYYFTYLEEQLEQEQIQKQQEETITKEIAKDVGVKSLEGFFKFGVTEEGFYSQHETGITYNKIIYSKDPNKDDDIKTTPTANAYIKSVEIVLDALGVLEPVYNVTYFNKTFNEEVTVEHLTKRQLTEEFIKANVFYISTKENVETVLNAFIIDGTKKDLIPVRTEAYLDGFFMVNGKVIENSNLKYLKKYTPEDVADAITLLNEIMEDRTEEGKANDSTVYRFFLWNPYSYCLKQIGLKTGIYSLILIGKTKGNKTGATKIGNLFYNRIEEETSGSTASVLGSKLEENTFSSVFDEAFTLLGLPEVEDIIKRSIQEKTGRITKNRIDNKKLDVFNAFNLPLFILNERKEFKDFITERFKITDYTSKSYLSKEARTKFNEKYLPDAEDSVLKKLAIIGNEFKKKIIPLIESKDKRLLKPEEITITILKEIAEETSKATGKDIDFLPEMYNITTSSENYNYDVGTAIRNLLNEEFKKRHKVINNEYDSYNFVNSAINNDFDFITYNKFRTTKTAEREFIINPSGLVKYVNNNIEETVELEAILEHLGLTEILKSKAESENKSYADFLKSQYSIKTDKGTYKNITGFYLTVEELANKLFSFNIEFNEED